MDLKKLTSTLLSSDSIKGLSSATGVSKGDVSSVLTEALPALLNGADEQAKGKKTAKSFADALTQHAKDDTSSLSKFFGGVDLDDGVKIVGHLLGSDQDSLTKSVAKKTGVSSSKTGEIISAAAPLLMSLLGQQAEEEEQASGLGGLLGGLLEKVDVGSLLTGLFSSDKEEEKEEEKEEKPAAKKKKTTSTAKKTDSAAKKTSTAKKTDSTAKKTTSTAKKTDSAAKKTSSTAKKSTSTAKKTGTTAKKTTSTAKKTSTTAKKTTAKK